MRNRVLSNSPRVRLSLAFMGTLLAMLVFVGCGGGGGGGTTTPPPGGGGNPNLATLTGSVQDTAHTPVAGATVTVVGTGRSAVTSATGIYTITNIPLGVARVTVQNPSNYYGYAQYNSGVYDLTACSFPVGTLVQGSNNGPTFYLYGSAGSNPPPPPPTGGCP